MSELSVRQYLHNDGSGLTWGYDKREADAVIAELEESHKREVEQLLMEIVKLKKERDWLAKDRAQAYDDLEKRAQLNIKQEESNRHHKYKRCLAMANGCADKIKYWHIRYTTAAGYDRSYEKWKHRLLTKWHKRWLEIAEKFKEAK